MKIYSTISGDTWDKVAFSELGEERLANLIIEANLNHIETVIFKSGVLLNIPEVSANLSDNLPPWKRGEK